MDARQCGACLLAEHSWGDRDLHVLLQTLQQLNPKQGGQLPKQQALAVAVDAHNRVRACSFCGMLLKTVVSACVLQHAAARQQVVLTLVGNVMPKTLL